MRFSSYLERLSIIPHYQTLGKALLIKLKAQRNRWNTCKRYTWRLQDCTLVHIWPFWTYSDIILGRFWPISEVLGLDLDHFWPISGVLPLSTGIWKSWLIMINHQKSPSRLFFVRGAICLWRLVAIFFWSPPLCIRKEILVHPLCLQGKILVTPLFEGTLSSHR